MGVPALFRWLSKKYPKIIYPVEEEEENKIPDEDGNDILIPVNMSQPNPNGQEFDNLYLDMNGIVHPCTHPEGKPAPETEEEMMVEIFKYTERVVNMVRPRKLLFMAIDGVAPRAKMNQQRSRRFRSSQEAKDKEDARKEAVAMWEAMGKTLSEEERTKESWDSNAITPGTPFMDMLAISLRYWVVQKMNTDPGWKQIQVIISDAGVPGEGEHKIMDWIRRQRANPGHDPNTRHVIYGLDADLIMLALATHEPHFRVLREDVFFQDGSATACRICGQEGHYAAQCTGVKPETPKKTVPAAKKPFIFLDVAILREYLEVELDVPQAPFPFLLEQAIDDWVLLIFFVGNDFLPHLPSLEIREGAIDTLLKIWKQELPRMGGYLTNHGAIELSRAQIILEGLAQREDEIFRRRKETEERQDQNAKRRKIEALNGHQSGSSAGPAPSLQLGAPPIAPSTGTAAVPPVHPSLPQRPIYDFAATADALGFGAQPTNPSLHNGAAATQALAGSNRDVVANRRAIRMANMSAAEMLKAELSGLTPLKPDLSLPPKPVPADVPIPLAVPIAEPIAPVAAPPVVVSSMQTSSFDTFPTDVNDIPGLGSHDAQIVEDMLMGNGAEEQDTDADADADGDPDPDTSSGAIDGQVAGMKRKLTETEGDAEVEEALGSDEDEAPADAPLALKVNPDGTVEQEDTVKLWEPGYKERYYRQKFGIELSDKEFRKNLTLSYIEGLAWVLHYYYQGTPSWQWYYPYHFAPFAADFDEVSKMDIQFKIGQPFKPFEQLMGVFPAASRKHIPNVFHPLMIDEGSPIIDFYPPTFEIDMNGKKMAWQGVALLPFIDEKRLLDAMAIHYPNLTEDEIRRNKWGNNVIFASDEHPLFPFYEQLYGKRKNQEPVLLDTRLSKGISGGVLPNPDCVPGSTYDSPLPTQGLPDIRNDRSLSVLYFFPKQLTPHRSVMLPGIKKSPRVLSAADLEVTRNGGRGRGRGSWDRGRGRGSGPPDRGNNPYQSRPTSYSNNSYNNDRGYGGRGGNSYSQPSYPPPQWPVYQAPPPQGYGGYSGGRPAQSYSGGNQYGGSSRGAAPRGGTPSYGSYGQGGYGSNSQGYGGNDGGGGYGTRAGYGGYGGQQINQGGYGNPSRGNAVPRGRGRGW